MLGLLQIFLLRHNVLRLVEHTGFVRGHHVLDVDEGVLAARLLEDLECLLDEVADVGVLLLGVVDAVALVHCRRRGHGCFSREASSDYT